MFAFLQRMPNWITAFGLGLVGCLLRVAIDRPVVWPHRRTADEGGPGFDLGFVGTLFTAGAAGSLLWVPLTSHLFADEGFGRYTIVAAIFVGLGGGDILMTYLSKWFGVSVSQQANQQVNQETSEIAKPLAEAQMSLSQQLSESQQREQQLRDELEKLETKWHS
jgi:hypothetical protein